MSLFDHQHVCACALCPQGGDEPARTGSDDKQAHFQIKCQGLFLNMLGVEVNLINFVNYLSWSLGVIALIMRKCPRRGR